MKGTEYSVTLQTSVITNKYNVMVNSNELIGATGYLTPETQCHINHCCYNLFVSIYYQLIAIVNMYEAILGY